MVNRPKGIMAIMILYSVLAFFAGLGTFATEQSGSLVEERYGDQLKLYLFFDYDKNLAIITGGIQVLILVGLVILLINRSSKARIGVLAFEIFSIGFIVITLMLPPVFFPQEHPYYSMHVSPIDDIASLIMSVMIILYMFRPKTIQYFRKSNEEFSENVVNEETK